MRQHASTRLVVALALIALPIPAANAQKQVFSSRALAVRIDAQVTEGKRPVAGLAAADFEVLDNGVPQRVSVVDSAEIPINVVLALEVSGSTAGQRMTDLVSARDAIIGGLKAGDRAGLTTFTHVASPRIALTTDVRAISRELREVNANGDTSVMDALYVALMQHDPQRGTDPWWHYRLGPVIWADALRTQTNAMLEAR